MAESPQVVIARKAADCPDRDPWIGVGRTLAGDIWGTNYVGTVPPNGLPIAGGSCISAECAGRSNAWLVDAGGQTTVPVWSAQVGGLYGADPRPPVASQLGVFVWGDDYVVSIPTRTSAPAPELALWTSEGVGGSNIFFVGESKLTSTDPADSAHMPMWWQIFRYSSQPGSHVAEEAFVSRDARAELRWLAETTRLPVEQLAELVGASRRTVYNWLSGRSIGEEARARIFRLRDALEPISQTRDSTLVRSWLAQGNPSSFQLAASEQWAELAARAQRDISPLPSSDEALEDLHAQPAETPAVLRAALVAFSTALEQPSPQRPGWKPREITGVTSEDEEDSA